MKAHDTYYLYYNFVFPKQLSLTMFETSEFEQNVDCVLQGKWEEIETIIVTQIIIEEQRNKTTWAELLVSHIYEVTIFFCSEVS